MTEQPADGNNQEKRYQGLLAEYAFISANDDYRYAEVKNCFLRNFGLTGASIYIYKVIPPDTNIYLRLYNPKDNSPIDIVCAVASVEPAGEAGGPNARNQSSVNLTYMNMNDTSKLRLEAAISYLESLAPKKKGGIDYR